MKKLALGIATAAVVFTAVPAMAQVGFYAGPGGVGVQFGPPYYNTYPYDGYYDYYGGSWPGHPVWHRHFVHRGPHWRR